MSKCSHMYLFENEYRHIIQPRQHSAGTKPRYILAQDCVAVTFDNDVFNQTDDHVEVQPHVPIRKTEIDILFSRNTVNKYDFYTLIPFAFGISPELSAENMRKSDARMRIR